mmetsp:Transcript_18051/g.23764  ORF Transcript_18051/g.23764 Transcript_18051/m.23764 type:complete len:258 (-) Transcript_18051:109-882(-)
MRLIQISLSHFCEKVQWGLNLKELPFQEEIYSPVFHVYPVKKLGLQKTSTPVLVDGDKNTIIQGSQDILLYLDREYPQKSILYPDNIATEIKEWEKMFDDQLGPAVRAWIYSEALYHNHLFRDAWALKQTHTQRFLTKWVGMERIARIIMWKGMELGPEKAVQSEKIIRDIFSRVNSHLEDQRTRYLCGNKFTAADLTFASLAAPILIEDGEGFWYPLPAKDQYPENFRQKIQELKASLPEVTDFVKRMYKDHRKSL